MAPKHISIAVQQGMKAGFRSFMSNPGLLPVQNLVSGLSTRKAFAAYCGAYGDQVAELKGNGRNLAPSTPKAKPTTQTPDVDTIVAAVLAALGQSPSEVVEDEVGVEVTESTPVKPKAVKPILLETTFGPGAIKALGLPTVAGKAFTYKGKNGKSKWVVAAKLKDGSIRVNRA